MGKNILKNNKGVLHTDTISYTNNGIELSWLITDGYFGTIKKGVLYDLYTEDLGDIKVRLIDIKFKEIERTKNCYTVYTFAIQE